MAPDDSTDILGFGFAGISWAEMILEITSKSCRFQENFDIASLTVADDVERIALGQDLKRFLQSFIDRSRMCEKFPVFFLTAKVDQFQLTLFFLFFKAHGGDVRKQEAETAFQRSAGKRRFQVGFLFQNTVPGTGNNICGVPQGTVNIEDDTVNHVFFLSFLVLFLNSNQNEKEKQCLFCIFDESVAKYTKENLYA